MSLPFFPFSRAAALDLVPRSGAAHDVDAHLAAGIDWLCRAQDATPDGGVSYGYSLLGGWRPSYIETTGYVACTFFNLASALRRAEYRERAIRMARWLVTVQHENGSFGNSSSADKQGIVFDTGQDLFGLLRAYRETEEAVFRSAARRAGDWLVAIADDADRWTRNTHLGIPHVYNTRTAWALLELNALEPKPEYERVARMNLDWGVSKQRANGWFDECAFESGAAPFTHTIAFAIRGLWESSRIVPDAGWEQSAIRGAAAMRSWVLADGFLPGQIAPDGRAESKYCCLTGNCQFAIIWAKLYEATGDQQWKDAAIRTMRFVMASQDLDTANVDVLGAIKGSHPIWGAYAPFTYPNWATKFFVDALLLIRGWL
ncbi:MAG: terpene cyclase/mutase family protein [Deltaproteobacteria bacterium]|nr:terpene cyclase/mutase family protein [Nannocystaceae bacterium]